MPTPPASTPAAAKTCAAPSKTSSSAPTNAPSPRTASSAPSRPIALSPTRANGSSRPLASSTFPLLTLQGQTRPERRRTRRCRARRCRAQRWMAGIAATETCAARFRLRRTQPPLPLPWTPRPRPFTLLLTLHGPAYPERRPRRTARLGLPLRTPPQPARHRFLIGTTNY